MRAAIEAFLKESDDGFHGKVLAAFPAEIREPKVPNWTSEPTMGPIQRCRDCTAGQEHRRNQGRYPSSVSFIRGVCDSDHLHGHLKDGGPAVVDTSLLLVKPLAVT
jgi:hypothetical protein